MAFTQVIAQCAKKTMYACNHLPLRPFVQERFGVEDKKVFHCFVHVLP
jgi:hypothetical protein